MELRHLHYFVAVAEELNFTRAAQRLHMAQPPLSTQIRQLEEEIGVPLLDRTTRSVALTDAGRHFLDHARQVLGQIERAKRTTRDIGEGRSGTLRIGSVYSAVYAVVPALLRLFGREYPDVAIELAEMTVQQQIDGLARGEIDVGILRSPINVESIATRPLFNEGIVALLPRDHALAQRDAIRLKDLVGEPFILSGIGLQSSFRQHVLGLYQSRGLTLSIVREVAEIHSIISLVGAGLGVSIAPASVSRIGLDDVRYLHIVEATPPIEVSLAWLENAKPPSLASLLDLLEHPEMKSILTAMEPARRSAVQAIRHSERTAR